jgi:BirA family biotin operon repressor/biotin-[acetyl-CoA-carboxylase] ligase
VVADEQTAGRGRLDRRWESPRCAGLWASVVLRPGDQPAGRWGWLPLLCGLAALDAVARAGASGARLKWPNDLIVEDAGRTAKLGGILLEGAGPDAVVAGIGINVSTIPEEFGELAPMAISLQGAGGSIDREALLADLLACLRERLAQWRCADGSLEADYRRACATRGRDIRVCTASGETFQGVAVEIADDGALLVESGGTVRKLSAGDVVHATI